MLIYQRDFFGQACTDVRRHRHIPCAPPVDRNIPGLPEINNVLAVPGKENKSAYDIIPYKRTMPNSSTPSPFDQNQCYTNDALTAFNLHKGKDSCNILGRGSR